MDNLINLIFSAVLVLIEENKEIPLWILDSVYEYMYDPKLEYSYITTHNLMNPPYGSLRYFLNEVGESFKKIYGPKVWVNPVFEEINSGNSGLK